MVAQNGTRALWVLPVYMTKFVNKGRGDHRGLRGDRKSGGGRESGLLETRGGGGFNSHIFKMAGLFVRSSHKH